MENIMSDTETRATDLKTWREGKGWKQVEAARFIGISATHYGMIERHAMTPRADLAKRIIDKTGVTLEGILGAA